MGQVLYIPHGGGPLSLLDDPGYSSLARMLASLNPKLAGQKAIIVVTAHWEGPSVGLSSSAQPKMLFDYGGFPDAAYRFRYDVPGAPKLAKTVARELAANSIAATLDDSRGFDHGTFVPMMLIRPEADIPLLQMSLLDSLDPAAHIAVGRALALILKNEEVTLIGSGFSFHNIPALIGRPGSDPREGQALAVAFHEWLESTICETSTPLSERTRSLESWAQAPGARFCQPREEHLLPLHACFGAAEQAGMSARTIFSEAVKGYHTAGYHWC